MTTLEQHVQDRHGPELAELFGALAGAARQIEQRIRTAPLSEALGSVGQTNVQGEQQQKLDVFANDTVIAALSALSSVGALVSEENDEPLVYADKPRARYVAIFDPLDGSSNIDVDVNVGTIVSVQEIVPGRAIRSSETSLTSQDMFAAALKPGRAQVAAMYVNYGPSTMLVYTAGSGVHSFTLSAGEFLLHAEDLQMPEHGSYYSVNEGNASEFPKLYRAYLDGLRHGSLLGHRLSSRYVGSFIADFHRTLLKGGVFLYPPTAKTPQGKLRLLYEANPLAWIAEEAGGMAVTGEDAAAEEDKLRPAANPVHILDLEPTHFHQRTTLVIGSLAEVTAFVNLAAASRLEAGQ